MHAVTRIKRRFTDRVHFQGALQVNFLASSPPPGSDLPTVGRNPSTLIRIMAHVLSDANSLIPKHTFIRSYQACVPCRKRKVKCDLGDPGNPSDPPCRRCRREHKECYFQDLRTKKGASTTMREVPRSAKRTRSESTLDSPTVQPHTASSAAANPLDELFQPTSSTSTTQHVNAISPNDSATADRILHKEVHNANEALNLLFEAAAESRSDTDDGNGNQTFDPRFSNQNDSNSLAWRDFWCVKAGWMTAIEARHYVDLFLSFIFAANGV
jgi:hypothetical protein